VALSHPHFTLAASGGTLRDVHKFIKYCFPSETFRVLKEKEEKQYDKYRTHRLVLEAWDKLEAK
jgi:hypothetical protein